MWVRMSHPSGAVHAIPWGRDGQSTNSHCTAVSLPGALDVRFAPSERQACNQSRKSRLRPSYLILSQADKCSCNAPVANSLEISPTFTSHRFRPGRFAETHGMALGWGLGSGVGILPLLASVPDV